MGIIFQGRGEVFFRAFGLWFSHLAICIVVQLGEVEIARNAPNSRDYDERRIFSNFRRFHQQLTSVF